MRLRIRRILATKGLTLLLTLSAGTSTAIALEVPAAPGLPTLPISDASILPGKSAEPNAGGATKPSSPATATVPTLPSAPTLSTPTLPAPSVPSVPETPADAGAPVAAHANSSPAASHQSPPRASSRGVTRFPRESAVGRRGSSASGAGSAKASSRGDGERRIAARDRVAGSGKRASGTRVAGGGATTAEPDSTDSDRPSFIGKAGKAAFAGGPRWALLLIVALALSIPAVAVMRASRRSI